MPYRWLLVSAAVLFGAVLSIVILEKGLEGTRATLESADGPTYVVSAGTSRPVQIGTTISAGETLRSDGGAMLRLADASLVELRSHSEMSLQAANDGIMLALNGGSIIVTAAKQGNGHLYVRTKDITVSVVGTVFLVNAEEMGSRVAVIQGEVQVQQGPKSEKLHPGEQLTSNPIMPPVPPSEEFSWSRNVVALMALLQQSAGDSQTLRASTPKWEAVSVRPCGAVGGGVGGRGGGPAGGGGSFSPGRLTLNCQVVNGLISAAYVINADGRRFNIFAAAQVPVEGGPPWVKSDAYTINAKAEGTPDRPMMSGPMLQAILEDRFKLKLRHLTREVPVYALTVAKGDPKLHPFIEGSCIRPPEQPKSGERRCSQLSTIAGPIWTFDQDAIDIEQFKNLISFGLDRPVIDETRLAGLFDFHFTYANPTLGAAASTDPVGAPSIFTAVEQFGLKLEAKKGLTEYLFIDSIERPSEN
jgi:uncharacterized protein (TIGR03435 family)